MIELISSDKKFNFSKHFSTALIFSSVIVLVSLFGAITKMNYGVDFRGGAEIQIKFVEQDDVEKLREVFRKKEKQSINIQVLGEKVDNEYLVKIPATEDNLNEVTQRFSDLISQSFGESIQIRKIDIVGPKAGARLRISGIQAMLWALLAIMIYIGLRFDFKYSPGAIVALFHDVSIILGFFAFSGMEFTLQTVAALLAVIGYSVNDTVIVYDRVREHEERYGERSLADHIDNAISETLSRTILTSSTTLFVSVAMYFLGGDAIKNFFAAMTLGVIVGTYSSIFIAAPVTLIFDKIKNAKTSKVATA